MVPVSMARERTNNINRIKVVLADKMRTNKWLAEQLGVAPTRLASGVLMMVSLPWKH